MGCRAMICVFAPESHEVLCGLDIVRHGSRLCRHERGIRLKERYSQGKISGKLKHRKAIGDRHKSLSLISYRKEAGMLSDKRMAALILIMAKQTKSLKKEYRLIIPV